MFRENIKTHPNVTFPLKIEVWPSPDTLAICIASVTKYPEVELPSPYLHAYGQSIPGLHSILSSAPSNVFLHHSSSQGTFLEVQDPSGS